ncbi:MAG TPA: type II toxin-antitoxin system VapC family toxin [Methylomirabilota bacterium]
MIVDTSALLAILFDEPDAERYARALAEADTMRLSAGNFVKAAVVVEAQTNASGRGQFDTLIRRAGIVIEPFTEEQAHIARPAYTDFGKGRHPAGLNFGDCFAYALAKATAEPLLFKGQDFSKTDVTAALPFP